jgi:hypothetical protein
MFGMLKNILDTICSWIVKPKTPSKITVKVTPAKTITTIKIMVKDEVVGVVQSLSISETRNIKSVIDPEVDVHIKATASRVRFDRQRVAEAFSRGFVHREAQKIPFDIEVSDGIHKTVLKNVWITVLGTTWSTAGWVIADQIELEAESIFSEKK